MSFAECIEDVCCFEEIFSNHNVSFVCVFWTNLSINGIKIVYYK